MLVIHGDNSLASREYFLQIKKQNFLNFLDLSGDTLTLADLQNALSTPDLFGQYPAVFIENFFSRRTSSQKTKISAYLLDLGNQNSSQTNSLFLYESKDISSQLKGLSASLIKNFPHPKHLYSFLESFSPDALRLCLKTDPPEAILASLAKHLQNLILVKENQGSFPDWQKTKLKTQSAKYSISKLTDMSNALLNIDYAAKTSKLSLSLDQSIELWCHSR